MSCLPKFKTTSRVGDGVLDGNLLIYLPTTHLIRRYFTQPAPIISSTQKKWWNYETYFFEQAEISLWWWAAYNNSFSYKVHTWADSQPQNWILMFFYMTNCRQRYRKISCFFQSKVDLHWYFPLSCHLRTITIRKHVSYSG